MKVLIPIIDLTIKIFDVLLPFFIPSLVIGVTVAFIFTLIDGERRLFVWRWMYYAYWALIVCETIIRRLHTFTDTKDYIGIIQLAQDPWYVVSAVENVMMFVPVGYLYNKSYRKTGVYRLLIGVSVCTVFIEVIQYALFIGEAQVIDVVWAIIGAWIGGKFGKRK